MISTNIKHNALLFVILTPLLVVGLHLSQVPVDSTSEYASKLAALVLGITIAKLIVAAIRAALVKSTHTVISELTDLHYEATVIIAFAVALLLHWKL